MGQTYEAMESHYHDLLSLKLDDAILIWHFEDAPKKLQELSEHGGDEDWVALIPKSFKENIPMFLDP